MYLDLDFKDVNPGKTRVVDNAIVSIRLLLARLLASTAIYSLYNVTK